MSVTALRPDAAFVRCRADVSLDTGRTPADSSDGSGRGLRPLVAPRPSSHVHWVAWRADLTLVRRPAPRCSPSNRVQAAPVKVSQRAPRAGRAAGRRRELRQRQRGDRHARRARRAGDRGRGRSAARPRRRAGARPLDRRDRRAACALDLVRAGLPDAAAALARRGRRGRGRGDHDHRHAPEGGGRRRATGFTVGGMAKGSGMIHPNLATMLAVVTTDYPLDAGRGDRVPAARRSTRASTRSRSTASARRTTPSCCSPTARAASRATPRPTLPSPRRCSAVCGELASQIVADGEGATFLADIDVRGAVDRAAGQGGRAPHRDLAARQDGALRPRRQLGPRPRRSGLRALQRRLRQRRPRPLTLRFNGTTVHRPAARRRASSPSSRAPSADRARPRARRRRGAATSPATCPTTTSASTRTTAYVKPVVVKFGGAVASDAVALVHGRSSHGGTTVCVVHGAGPQISAEMERRGLPVEFVGGRRVTTPEALEVVRESLAAVNADAVRGDRPAAPSACFGDEIGLQADAASPGLGQVGDAAAVRARRRARGARGRAASRSSRRSRRARSTSTPTRPQPRSRSASAPSGILFLTDVPGLLLDGAVVPRSRRTTPTSCSTPASSRAASCPSCAPPSPPRGSACRPRSARRRCAHDRSPPARTPCCRPTRART